MIHWDYTSYQEVIDTIHTWCDTTLPHISAVAGIPRSGVFSAAIIAQRLAIPLVSLDALRYGTPEHFTKYNKTRQHAGPILVVDDGYWTGDTMRWYREELFGIRNLIFGSVYAKHPFEHLDVFGKEVTNEHGTFEYNFMRQGFTDRYVVEWSTIAKPDGKPTHLLPTFPVLAIVTRSDRRDTQIWLDRYGVETAHVIGVDDWRGIANAYLVQDNASLCVVSSSTDAEQIHETTERPVFATDTDSLFQF